MSGFATNQPAQSGIGPSGEPTPAPTTRGQRWPTVRKCRYLTYVCGLLPIAIALVVLTGWIGCWYARGFPLPSQDAPDRPLLAALLPGSNAMVLASTIGFLAMGTAVLLHLMGGRRGCRRHLVAAVSVICGAWAVGQLVEFALHETGMGTTFSMVPPVAWLLQAFHDAEMAPGAAVSWLLVATALFLLARRPGWRKREVAAVAAAAVIAINIVLVYGFFCSQQLFKSYLKIAVAFPAALSFVFLGVGLLAAAGPRNILLRHLVGPTTKAVLLRTFLAVAVGAIILSEVVHAYLSQLEDSDLSVVLVGLWVYVVVVLVGAAAYWVAGRVGSALEQARAELQQTLAELRVKRDQAQAAALARDMFLAQVSHELRTPLNHILGYCQLLEYTSLDSAQQTDLHKIRRAGDHLLSLINDILDYQKIVIGKIPLEMEDFELAPVIQEIAETMTAKVEEKGNRLEVDCASDVGAVRVDRKRLRQVLTNLLSNAAKFTRQGTIAVIVRRQCDDGSQEWLAVSVADSGRGISLPEQAKLFQPFAKVSDGKENPEGTGLGLAISRNLCRLMGGDIAVASELGKGSTFTIRLPAAQAVRPTGGPTVTREPRPTFIPAAGGDGLHNLVLVVDDDPQVGELMRRFLEGEGYRIHIATSGAQALETVKGLRPAVITLDVLMPGIDGWGVLAALKNDEETADIPVIIVSITEDRAKGFRLGASEYVTKPVDWERLTAMLRKYLGPRGGSILVVDDDAAMRELCRRTLTQSGWHVVEADNGRAALDRLNEARPSLILLDLMMPVMDGFEFLEWMRRNERWRTIPVVVMTAKDLTEDDHRRLNGCVLDILEKQKRGLEDLLREILQDVKRYVPSPAPVSKEYDCAKILVVEDDAQNRDIAVRLLRMRGYDVVSAINGPDGVAMALSEKPDLILMDMGLPNPEDGLIATRAIRVQPGTETIPIIAFTARAMSQEVEKAYAAGCNEFASKPIDFALLLTKIQLTLDERRRS